MNETLIKFERENLDGLIPVGTYLADAARRMGVELACADADEPDDCSVKITGGAELLSELTAKEIEKLSEKRRKSGERLASQTKIEKAGEITIMTHEKKAEEKPAEEVKQEEYRKEFEELPLDKKIASLLELEAVALRETINFVINSPFKIFDLAMGVMAQFGLKLDKQDREATRPDEHKTNGNGNKKAADANAKTVNESNA